ncbi:MAG TPA: GNAT family N-acetyltransferase [Roseiflexaceae bacterium]|nr:GNAT family N-acetyltransferase [Roseiflexaceae bacterium]
MLQIETTRLRLLPCSIQTAQAAISDRAALEWQLGARVPAEWPAEDLRDFLPVYGRIVDDRAASHGWGIWLILDPAERSLVGDIGFKGPPDDLATIEIGYSILPAFQGRGYASEAARALIAWGFAQAGVRRIVANCLADNAASIRVLQKAGMRQTGRDRDGLTWELTAVV